MKGKKSLTSLTGTGESWLVLSHGTISKEMKGKQLGLEFDLVAQPPICWDGILSMMEESCTITIKDCQ